MLYIMAVFENELRPAFNALKRGLVDELREQGHVLTGSLAKSIELQVTTGMKELTIEGSFNRYGVYLDRGVKPSRIPYTPNSGRKNSKYIAGLIDFIKKRRIALSTKKALPIAFAIAKTQKREGMPTRGSKRFSKNGSRKDWIQRGLDRAETEFINKLNDVFQNDIEIQLENFISQTNKLIQ